MNQEKAIKDISVLELWWPFCLAERCHLHCANLVGGIIMNISVKLLDQSFRCGLKDFLSRAMASLM